MTERAVAVIVWVAGIGGTLSPTLNSGVLGGAANAITAILSGAVGARGAAASAELPGKFLRKPEIIDDCRMTIDD
ncbi:MAG: hypothetical protein EHM61_27745 [Acidobacteria bacterium]|nr:MAG: hypothetical protein EHM61_27745 [Acidobacteriota bacterium]